MSENLKIPQTIYLAVWTHLQGQDISAHTTEKGAYEQCAAWSHESLNQWEDASEYIAKFANYTHEELCANWCEITDYTEFLRVDTVLLNDDALENVDAESEKD
mgnify:CR=1 FL=1|jgi:hypothetical protein